MSEARESETVRRLLLAAEELFAQRGYNGTSLREITQKAKVNLAASHYHLGDKESLYLLIVSRRMRTINEVRLAQLEQAEQEADGQPASITRILEAMARPFFELCADQDNGGRYFARILGRSLIDPLPFMDSFLAKELQPATARFAQALRRQAPTLSPEEFLWRLSFVVGAMHHTLATMHCMKDLTRGICRNHDHAEAISRFIQFATVAMLAPVPATASKPTAA